MRQKIYINQLGYLYNKDKKAMYVGSFDSFSVVNALTQKVLYSGTLSKPVHDNSSDESVRIADFSSFNIPGKYYIKIGMKKSYAFRISDNPYALLKSVLLKGLFYNRCGFDFKDNYDDFCHKKCHTKPVSFMNDETRTADVTGGWHDGGGYNRNTSASCFTIAYLLYAYKLFPNCYDKLIINGYTSKKYACIIEEAKIGLDWLLKMQDKDGGVFEKVASVEHSEITLPEEDSAKQYIYPVTVKATADFTAVMALASAVFSEFDKKYAEKLKNASVNSWVWLMNNTDDKSIKESEDNSVSDMMWASCELFAILGDDFFGEKILSLYKSVDFTDFSRNSAGGLSALSYLLSSHERNRKVMSAINTSYRVSADNIDSLSKSNPYLVSKGRKDYCYCSNMNSMGDIIVLFIANRLLGNDDYITSAIEQINYILGRNCLGMCFVTGVGSCSVSHPHHRVSAVSYINKPVPGMLVCGPNSERRDEYTRWSMPQDTPPAKCYEDSMMSRATNEPQICISGIAVLAEAFIETVDKRNIISI